MSFWKSTLASILGTVIAGILLFCLGILFISFLIPGGPGRAPSHSVLKIELRGSLSDKGDGLPNSGAKQGFLSEFGNYGVYEIRQLIQRAAKDDKIKGIYLRPGLFEAGWASLESLHDELLAFKKSGKFIVAWSDVYTEASYYLASTADHISLYPEGFMEFNGLASTPVFYKGMLDKLKLEPRVFKVGTFKSFVEPYVQEKMSEANRLQTQVLLNDLWGHYLKQISQTRKSDPVLLDSLADDFAVWNDKMAAVEAGLLHQLGGEDQSFEWMREKMEIPERSKLRLLSLRKYASHQGPRLKRKYSRKKIAVIFAEGAIMDGMGTQGVISSDEMAKSLREVRRDSNIKAVVLRINSPGGSALASDIIHREIQLTREKKPVFASMGDVAASGGYYIAAACDRIYARNATVTGSIGIFAMLPGTGEFFSEKLGLSFDRVTTHKHADLGNPNRPMTEAEIGIVQNSIERGYSRFVEVVRSGRNFQDSLAVDSIAQGRVWSGSRALELGLVDGIAGLDSVIALAAKEQKLDAWRIKTYPKDKDLLDLFNSWVEDNYVSLEGRILDNIPQGELIRKVNEQSDLILSRDGRYMMMPFELDIN